MAEWKTLGEALVERELETEIRQGVEHYVEGQRHIAIEESPDPNLKLATLSFVSAAIQSAVAIIVVAIAAVILGATAKAIGMTVHIVEIISYVLVILIELASGGPAGTHLEFHPRVTMVRGLDARQRSDLTVRLQRPVLLLDQNPLGERDQPIVLNPVESPQREARQRLYLLDRLEAV